MLRNKRAPIGLILLLMLALLLTASFASAYTSITGETEYKNSTTGYEVWIEDPERLISDAEKSKLVQDMIPLTEYGNVAFVSCNEYSQSTASFAKNWYYNKYQNDSGTAFVIDMGNRNIYIVSAGAVYKTVTKGYANTITDNVYLYATRGDYYSCAANAFEQEYSLLEGGRIARPMKHITNALVAIILAILINYILAMYQRRGKETPVQATFAATTFATLTSNVNSSRVIKEIRYLESDDDDEGGGFFGGGGGFSGGGFSGGGFSGGGGGHSF